MKKPELTPGLCLVPVSPAMAALVHQLHKEVAEAQGAPEPGSAVLTPMGPLTRSSACNATYHRAYGDGYRSGVYLNRSTLGAPWTGDEERVDTQGRVWTRRIKAVTNDFGDLVEVAP